MDPADDLDEDGDDLGGVAVGVLGPQNTWGGVVLCHPSVCLDPQAPS